MSQHKTGKSSLSEEDRKLYWERRGKGLPGIPPVVTVYRTVKDDNGNDTLVAVGRKTGSTTSTGKADYKRSQRRAEWRAYRSTKRKEEKQAETSV